MRAPSAPPAPSSPSLTLPELLDGSAWFPLLDAAAQARVLDEMRYEDVPAGMLLSRFGESPRHWYGVMHGLLKWSRDTADGHSITFGGLSVGSWFGEGTLLRGAPRRADIIALKDSRVAVMPKDTFGWLYATELSFCHFLLDQINERMHWFMESYAAHRMLDADGQVARALAGLFHPWLYPRGERHLQVSQEEIANLSGVSRPRCNQALKRLRDAGLLRIEYGGLMIVDLEGLRRAAGD